MFVPASCTLISSFRFPPQAGGTSLTIGSPHAVGETSRRGIKSSSEMPLLIVHPDPNAPLVAIEVWVRAGSAYETAETAGAAHLLEHLIFKGTSRHPAGTLDATVEAAGGILQASTEREWTRYRTAVLPDHWELVLRQLLEHLLHPALPESELLRERALMLQDEYALYQADPIRTARDALYAQVYGEHPYALPPFGVPKSLSALSRAQLLDFHRRYYRPDRMVIVVVGAVSPERVQQVVQAVCRPWSDGLDESDKSDEVGAAPTPTLVSLAPHRALFVLGVPAPPATQPNAMLAAEIVRLALAEPYRGLLYEGQPPFLHLQSEYLPRTQSGLMLFFFQLASESADGEPVRQRWHAALRQIMEGRARPQLEQARQWLITRHQQAMRNPVERARLYGLYATLGMPTLPDEYLQRVRALTLDQIEKVAQQMEQAERAVWHSEITTRLERVETSPPSPIADSQPFRQVLANRMRVIALRQPGAKQVVMQLLVATGPDAEGDFPAGTSELTARMLFTATQNETQATLAYRIARSGGALELHYEPIGVRITAVAEPAAVENVLALLREGLTRAEFEADALQRALQAAQAERQRMDGTHELPLYDALLRQLVEGGTLYARNTELQQVRLKHIRAFYARYYRPERFVLVIAGDLPTEQLTELVQRHWASVSQVSSAESPLTPTLSPLPKGGEGEGSGGIRQPLSDAPTLYLGFGLRTEVCSPEEYAALLTLHALLCEGKRSLLFKHFREVQGMGYAFGGMPVVWQGKGFLLGFLQVGRTRLAQRDELLRQMAAMVRTLEPKPEDLQRAVALVEARWRRDSLDIFERTRRIALAEASGIGYLTEQNLPERLKQVSVSTLQSLLEKSSSSVPLGVK